MSVFITLSYTGIDLLERPFVNKLVSAPWAREGWMIFGLALLGALVGIGQWILLRPFIDRPGQWGLAIFTTYWAGASLTEVASATGTGLLPGFALSLLLLGPVCGFWQSAILRTQVRKAGWWTVAQTLGWLALLVLTAIVAYGTASVTGASVDGYLPLGYALGGASLGAITGAALVWLLRHPAAKTGEKGPVVRMETSPRKEI